MRIALFHNLPSGGAKRAVYEWIRRLAPNNQIDVYTLSSADHTFCDIRPFVQNHRVFDFMPRKLFESPFGRLNQFQRWRDLGELTQIGRQIAKEINAGHYDVVFANTCYYTFIPTCLQWVEKPAIYYLHEPFGPTFARRFQRPYMQDNGWREKANRYDPLIKIYHHRLETLQLKSVRHTTRLLANSQFTQKQMKLAYDVDTPVCHYGVNIDTFHPRKEVRKEDFVLSVGELTPRKGFDFIVDSLGRIPIDSRPRLKLACNMVDSRERAYVEGLAVRYEVDLEVYTRLNADELAVLYNQAQLCVYAPVMEPFGLVPLEAMSCGTPVVGVAEGGVRESVISGFNGCLTDRDPAKFAQAVLSLIANPDLRKKFGRQAREYVVDKWSWDQSVNNLSNHLMNLGGGFHELD